MFRSLGPLSKECKIDCLQYSNSGIKKLLLKRVFSNHVWSLQILWRAGTQFRYPQRYRILCFELIRKLTMFSYLAYYNHAHQTKISNSIFFTTVAKFDSVDESLLYIIIIYYYYIIEKIILKFSRLFSRYVIATCSHRFHLCFCAFVLLMNADLRSNYHSFQSFRHDERFRTIDGDSVILLNFSWIMRVSAFCISELLFLCSPYKSIHMLITR